MKKFQLKLALILLSISFILFVGLDTTIQSAEIVPQEAEILQAWQGDFPVAQLDVLPVNQRERSVGFIDNAKAFATIWKRFKSSENVPEINFAENLVLFARNTHFYNRISIGRVNIVDGIAEVLAMETMSAMTIEDMVGMSLVVIPRKGIVGVRTGGEIMQLSKE